jgi:hypothetical protein
MGCQMRILLSLLVRSACLIARCRAWTHPSAYPKIPKWRRKNPGECLTPDFFGASDIILGYALMLGTIRQQILYMLNIGHVLILISGYALAASGGFGACPNPGFKLRDARRCGCALGFSRPLRGPLKILIYLNTLVTISQAFFEKNTKYVKGLAD